MIEVVAVTIVYLSGVYLVCLGALCLQAPAPAARFLGSFASSARAHYFEMAMRLAAGASFVVCAPRMHSAAVFSVLGWLLLLTTLPLFAVPWRWHRRFAQAAIPHAIRNMKVFGLCSVLFGGLVLGSAYGLIL